MPKKVTKHTARLSEITGAVRAPRVTPARVVRAKYDAAQTTDDNRRHWANADSLSPDESANPMVRQALRNRCRYEYANNSYCKGIVDTLATDAVGGSGPWLEMSTDDEELNSSIEDDFAAWAEEIGLAEILRTMRVARAHSGEAFALMSTNPRIASDIKLYLQLVEPEQVTDPFGAMPDLSMTDGIEFDTYGNPSFYNVLRFHPGGTGAWGWFGADQFRRWPAKFVLHYYRPDRPGQRRGVPDLTPAVQLFAELRRYTNAVIAAAETAADYAAVLQSDAPADADSAESSVEVAAMDTVELARRLGTVLPQGYKLAQIHAEQPVTTYGDFVDKKLEEIARCLGVPWTIAALNSSKANMSASYLDGQRYANSVTVDRTRMECLLNRLLDAWLTEWVAMYDKRRIPRMLPHQWIWPSMGHHADPNKTAAAQEIQLAIGTTTIPREYAKEGKDWQKEQKSGAKALGITEDQYRADVRQRIFKIAASLGASANAEQTATPDRQTDTSSYGQKPMSTLQLTAAKAPGTDAFDLHATGIQIEARTAETETAKSRRFEMLAYTGGAMEVAAFAYPVVVDLAGMETGNSARPILVDHDPSLESVLGQTDKIEVRANQLVVAGKVFGESDRARQVIALNDRGFQFQASIGARVTNREFVPEGSTVKVNGQTFNGPIHVARKTVLGEVSFVILGADDNTSARIAATAAKGIPMTFEQWLEAKGIAGDLSDAVRNTLKAQFESEQAAKNNGGGGTGSGGNGAASGNGGTVNAGAAGGGRANPQAQSLDNVIGAERKKEERQQAIVNLTATALQENPGQLQIIEAMSRQAMAGDWETQRYELELLRATRPQAGGMIRQHPDDRLGSNVIEAGLCLAGNIESPEKLFNEQTLEAASKRWRHGLGLGEVLIMFARRNGYDAMGTRDVAPLLRAAFAPPPVMFQASGISTLSLPNILSTVANRFFRTGFNSVESTWRSIAAIRPVKDFRAVTSYSLTGDFTYIEVAPDGQLKHATAGETGYTNQAKTYGRMFAIDRRDIINDDLGALTDVPKKLGRGGALKFNLVFWTTFMNNASFFVAGNNNYLVGVTPDTNDSRLNVEGLTRAETAFLNQTDPDGAPFAATPKILLVPNALTVPAASLMRDTELRTTTANTTATTGNPHAGKFEVARSSYLSNSSITGNSAVAWYLLADPNDVPVVEAAFLNGNETPTVEQADADFNQLGIQMRGYHDFGVSLQEPRGAIKSKGAA